jgi:catechol-2,3-dioxygenase
VRRPRSGNHHDPGLVGVGADAPPKVRGGVGLYHLAWQLDTIEELAEAHTTLKNAGAYTGQSSHGPRKASICGADPDANEFELMWMLPRQHWGKYANAAPVELLELDAELARWSGVPTAGRITLSNSDEDNQ